MEIIIGIIAALLGGVFYFKGKADKAAVDAKLGELRGRDKELKKREGELNELIGVVDEALEANRKKTEEKKEARKYRSLKERKEESNKRFGRK